MIASLRGTVLAVDLSSVVIETGGVGYKVSATAQVLAQLRIGAEATLSTSLIVREDSMTIYGFHEPTERDLFEILGSVSGIGPKLALAILSVHTPGTLKQAIANEDSAALRRVPGIGDKTAKRMILELQGKLDAIAVSTVTAAQGQSDVVMALLGLGWSEKQARQAVDEVMQNSEETNSGAVLREALQLLGSK